MQLYTRNMTSLDVWRSYDFSWIMGLSIDAYYRGDYNESRMELCHGFPVVDFVYGKQNALHIAIGNGNRDLVELLLERGADKSLPGWSTVRSMKLQTMSPVEIARTCGYKDVSELLESPETIVDVS